MTHLCCDEVFNSDFIVNFLPSLMVKESSVVVWRGYEQQCSVTRFTHSAVLFCASPHSVITVAICSAQIYKLTWWIVICMITIRNIIIIHPKADRIVSLICHSERDIEKNGECDTRLFSYAQCCYFHTFSLLCMILCYWLAQLSVGILSLACTVSVVRFADILAVVNKLIICSHWSRA